MPFDLQTLVAWAAIVSCVCSVVAAGVAVRAWRKTESKDLSELIEKGDKAVRLHAQESTREVRKVLDTATRRLTELEDSQARIEANQQHYLKARDLGPLHEKINALAREQAATGATTKAIHEQLRLIQNLIMGRKA